MTMDEFQETERNGNLTFRYVYGSGIIFARDYNKLVEWRNACVDQVELLESELQVTRDDTLGIDAGNEIYTPVTCNVSIGEYNALARACNIIEAYYNELIAEKKSREQHDVEIDEISREGFEFLKMMGLLDDDEAEMLEHRLAEEEAEEEEKINKAYEDEQVRREQEEMELSEKIQQASEASADDFSEFEMIAYYLEKILEKL